MIDIMYVHIIRIGALADEMYFHVRRFHIKKKPKRMFSFWFYWTSITRYDRRNTYTRAYRDFYLPTIVFRQYYLCGIYNMYGGRLRWRRRRSIELTGRTFDNTVNYYGYDVQCVYYMLHRIINVYIYIIYYYYLKRFARSSKSKRITAMIIYCSPHTHFKNSRIPTHAPFFFCIYIKTISI